MFTNRKGISNIHLLVVVLIVALAISFAALIPTFSKEYAKNNNEATKNRNLQGEITEIARSNKSLTIAVKVSNDSDHINTTYVMSIIDDPPDHNSSPKTVDNLTVSLHIGDKIIFPGSKYGRLSGEIPIFIKNGPEMIGGISASDVTKI